MKSYKFKDYVLVKEVFELPNHGDSHVSSILSKLNTHDIVEFAIHVAEDALQYAGHETAAAQRCIKTARNWLNHPSHETAEAAYNASRVAPDEELGPALLAAVHACTAAYFAQEHNVKAAAEEGGLTAANAGMAAFHDSNDNMRNPGKVYQKIFNKYKSWASAYHVTPIAPHANKQEIAKLMDEDGKKLPYLLDYLEENGMKPSNFTLKQFGVNKFENNNEIAQQIIENGMLSGFYRAISNSLAKLLSRPSLQHS